MVVRFNTDDVTIHLASAGAGKTTTAMQVITDALKSYRPDEIAFVTYTRKGVETGVARALAVNKDLTPDDLMHFKTLHALCFREAHLARKNIITQSDIAQFNSELGFSLTMNDAFGHVTEDDRLLQRYDAERSGSKRGVFVDGNYDRFRYDRLVNAYKAFKEGHDLVDFYDCLLKYMEQGEPLQGVKIALIDECQDLTPLQWQVCMKAFSEAEKVICLGDDFQCQPEGTKVLTEHGYLPIEACSGQRLITLDLETMTYKKSEPVQLESHYYDSVGYKVEIMGSAPQYFTAEHKMVTRVYGELRVIPIAECYKLSHRCLRVPLYDEEEPWNTTVSQPIWAIPHITEGYLRAVVYSLDVPKHHTYVTKGGLTVHNCLYTYNGAAPELLVEMASHYKTVKHEISYRLPRKVYEFSKGITDLIQEKVEKDYRPADDREGFVETLPDRNVLARLIRDDLKSNGVMPGRWYLLFRTNCFIADMAMVLEQFIVPYHTSKGFCIPARDLNKIERYYNYRKVGYGNEEAKQRFMEENKIADINDSFMHSELISGKERYFYQDLVDTWGLETLKKMSTMTEPFCLLSTVHKVKGGEADYTAMFMDCTRVVSENITLNADEELRVLYVGCTRSREGLYLIPASGKYSLSKLIDIVKELNDD